MEATYIRDAEACMGFCRGFGRPEITLTLVGMIDLMFIHSQREGGIPAEPPSYLAGMVGVHQKLMSQTIIPTLIKAGRVKRATRNGIKIYVFPDDMMRGPKALFRPIDHIASQEVNVLDEVLAKEAPPSLSIDAAQSRQQDPVATDHPFTPSPPPDIAIEDTTPVPDVPSHSAYQILKQAGVDVDNHERGEFFWHRTEHNEVLSRWMQEVSTNEIVILIDKARIANKLPSNPNSLLAYESIVLGGDL